MSGGASTDHKDIDIIGHFRLKRFGRSLSGDVGRRGNSQAGRRGAKQSALQEIPAIGCFVFLAHDLFFTDLDTVDLQKLFFD